MNCPNSTWSLRYRWVRAAWAAALALGSYAARADELIIAGQRVRDVRVSGLADGKVEYTLSDGKSLLVWIDEIQRFVVDQGGIFVDFNLAEQYLHDGEPLKAIPRYERTNNLAPDFWADLIHARLAMAHDRAGHIDRSTFYFLRVARGRHGGVAAASRVYPQSIPSRRDGPVARALDVLGDAISKGDPDQRALYSVLRYEILRKTDSQAAKVHAAAIAELIIPSGARTSHTYEIQLHAMRDLVVDNKVRLKSEWLESAIRDCPESALPRFLLLKGELLAASAAERNELIRAAWTLLRIPIHFPSDVTAPVALREAANILVRLNMHEQAESLLTESANHPKATPELRDAIDRARNEQ